MEREDRGNNGRPPGEASNEGAPPVNEGNGGRGGGGFPLGRILLIALLLLLLLLAIPFACQALRGGGEEQSGGAGDPGEQTDPGASGQGAGGAASEGEATNGTGESTTGTVESASLGDIETQTGDGTSVTVPEAEIVGASGWIAVREDENGEPGDVLGYAPLQEGQNTDVQVSLDTPVSGSGELFASVHVDDPADGNFTFPDADPTVESGGEAIQSGFTYNLTSASEETTAQPQEAAEGEAGEGAAQEGEGASQDAAAAESAAVSVEPQQSGDGASVSVPEASISGVSGWVSVREGGNGEPGAVLGYAPIEEGENADVEVPLDAALSGTNELVVSVHADEPADESFTFPEGDPTVEDATGTVSYNVEAPAGTPEDALPDTGGAFDNRLLTVALGAGLLLLGTLPLIARRRYSEEPVRTQRRRW